MSTTTASNELPPSSIPIFRTVAAYRAWRTAAFRADQTVGFVPTMGALHDGHLSLVRRSLAENDLTVVSIFVNPAQFAPHEDLATYPRTLPQDLALLEAEKLAVALPDGSITGASTGKMNTGNRSTTRTPSAVFLPTVPEMYPSGIVQSVAEQKGTFVEVKGYSHQMEGTTRPTFFRGVATVVTKLFNAIQPTRAYFGQKDIQQALLLRRMARDLLLAHPAPQHVHIVRTARDPASGLALSSRNAYLSPAGRAVAPALRHALLAAEEAWHAGASRGECLARARGVVEGVEKARVEGLEVVMDLDYVEMNDASTFEVLPDTATKADADLVILSGALYVDKTRLIDNILLGDTKDVLS